MKINVSRMFSLCDNTSLSGKAAFFLICQPISSYFQNLSWSVTFIFLPLCTLYLPFHHSKHATCSHHFGQTQTTRFTLFTTSSILFQIRSMGKQRRNINFRSRDAKSTISTPLYRNSHATLSKIR